MAGMVLFCNVVALRRFLHFTSSQRKVHFASLKVATFHARVVKEERFCCSGSEVAAFQYECSKGSTLWQPQLGNHNFSVQVEQRKYTLAAPAWQSQLFNTSGVKEESLPAVATFQYKCWYFLC